MFREIAGLIVDIAPPERPKFKCPLFLIHGLWSGSWSWQSWSTHFSNLGWECWSINFKGRADPRESASLARLTSVDCVADLKNVIRAAPSPPVLLGHDFGGLIAQRACPEESAAALIVVSSPPAIEGAGPLPREMRLLRLKYWPLLFLRRPFSLNEKDLRAYWLASLEETRRKEAVKGFVPESAHLVGEFLDRSAPAAPGPVRCPVLAVGGADDRVVSPAELRDAARRLGADLKEYPGHGHWLLGEQGGEEIVRDIHRWLVRKLGEEILLAEFPPRP